MPYTIHYNFSQHFAVPAKVAFEWCIDYQPEDHALMGETNTKREVIWLTECTAILKETFHMDSGIVEKQKLVHLYPNRLSWVSTHLSGPNKYSQFIYQITSESEMASRLDFNAQHLEPQGNLSQKDLKLLTDKLCEEDSELWKLLAKAMERELSK